MATHTSADKPDGWRAGLPASIRPYTEAAPLAALFLGISSGFPFAINSRYCLIDQLGRNFHSSLYTPKSPPLKDFSIKKISLAQGKKLNF